MESSVWESTAKKEVIEKISDTQIKVVSRVKEERKTIKSKKYKESKVVNKWKIIKIFCGEFVVQWKLHKQTCSSAFQSSKDAIVRLNLSTRDIALLPVSPKRSCDIHEASKSCFSMRITSKICQRWDPVWLWDFLRSL